ncbi:MAG: hopanoid biosynthesis associated radical SAM protein HpnH [Flavobacteriales bacterium CG_4_9_14_3_um_filter_40_17]|nr:MAG: hopanoid biosynthesis associated radical SAM protein HpnH [Flavobacteriales bacterium CG_4_9_14_3_um_filter_40_17]
MGVPIKQQINIASYIIKKKLKREKKYPLVLMLEPLFQCNLACAGCGKIAYEEHTLKRRMSFEDAMKAVDECGAPVISIPGGEPLIHNEMPQIVKGLIQRKKYIYLCTNAIMLKRKIHAYEPSHYLTFSIHLDGLKEHHDKSVCKEGVFEIAVEAIKLALDKGHRVTINCTLFNDVDPKEVADFFDFAMKLGVEGIMVSPGYSYEMAPEQELFLGRNQSKELFRGIFREGKKRKSKWEFNQSALFLDFLAGNQSYQCTPWSTVTYNIFGWQKPCYLLVNEGYAKSYKELIEDTEWDKYGVGHNPKCDNCMVHCGFEGTAVNDSFKNPLKLLELSLNGGPKTEGPLSPDLPITYDLNKIDKSELVNPQMPIIKKKPSPVKKEEQLTDK